MATIYPILYILLVTFLGGSCIESEDPIWDTDIPASEDFTASNGFWNQDGSKIFFQHDDLSNSENLKIDEIWYYDINSGERGKVFSDFAINADINVDESKFIYHKANIPEYLYEYSVNDNSIRRLTGTSTTNDLENTILGRYSPDYSKILTTVIAGKPRGIAIMGINGKNAELIVEYGIMGGWFPDSKRIIYINWVEGSPAKNTKQIFEANIDGSNQKVLTDLKNTYRLFNPVVSPDGKTIAFGNDAGEGNSELFLMDYETGEIRQITKGIGFAESFAWSPDGNKILFDRFIPNVSKRLYLIDTQTLEVEPLFPKL